MKRGPEISIKNESEEEVMDMVIWMSISVTLFFEIGSIWGIIQYEI